jgi:hypothetical protein
MNEIDLEVKRQTIQVPNRKMRKQMKKQEVKMQMKVRPTLGLEKRQAKVGNLAVPVGVDEDVGRFQVAVDDLHLPG